MKSSEGPQSPNLMQVREISEGILKRWHNDHAKKIALTKTKLKNRDHDGVKSFPIFWPSIRSKRKEGQNMGKDFSYWRPMGKDEF